MTHKQTTAFHLFSFPQLHLGFFCFFTFTAWHKLWVLCLAFFRAWCASQIVTKAFLHAPHNKSFLYSFLSEFCTSSYRDSKIATLSCSHTHVPPLSILPAAWMYVYFQRLFPRFSAPFFPLSTTCFFLSAFYILRFFWGGAILKCYMILLMRTLTRNSSA